MRAANRTNRTLSYTAQFGRPLTDIQELVEGRWQSRAGWLMCGNGLAECSVDTGTSFEWNEYVTTDAATIRVGLGFRTEDPESEDDVWSDPIQVSALTARR